VFERKYKDNIYFLLCLILAVNLNERVYGDEFVEDEFASEVVIESVNVDESEELKPPRIEAKAAIVIDADTGRVLYERMRTQEGP